MSLFGHGGDVVGVADLAHLAVQSSRRRSSIHAKANRPRGRPRRCRRRGRRCPQDGRYRVVLDQVVAAPTPRTRSRAGRWLISLSTLCRRARVLDELAQLLRDPARSDHHGTVVDAGSVVAHPSQSCSGSSTSTAAEGLPSSNTVLQLVEARIGEVRGGDPCAFATIGAVARRRPCTLSTPSRSLVLRHLRIGRLEAGVVVRHEGHARRLGLVYLVEGDGVLLHAFVCQRQQALQCARPPAASRSRSRPATARSASWTAARP